MKTQELKNLKTKIVMEKKSYIKPEIEVMELELESLMLTDSFIFSEDDVDSEKEQLVIIYKPGRRGKWGDLWYVEEEQ